LPPRNVKEFIGKPRMIKVGTTKLSRGGTRAPHVLMSDVLAAIPRLTDPDWQYLLISESRVT